MRLFRLLGALSALLLACSATDDGLTDMVKWDRFSLTINGSRVFIL
jgi:beta-galactosidase